MTTRVVRFKVKDEVYLIEIEPSLADETASPSDPQSTSNLPEDYVPVVANQDIETCIELVKSAITNVATELYDAIRSIPSPQKTTIEFGINLGAETSIIPIFTKASGNATFKVVLEWQPDAKKE